MSVKPSIIKRRREGTGQARRVKEKERCALQYYSELTTPSIKFDKKGSIVTAEARNQCYLRHEEHLVFQDGADSRLTECSY